MRILVLILILLGSFVSNASAINVRFLSDSALSRMSPEDIGHFETALADALNNLPDGGRVQWSNPETGARGIIVIDETYSHEKMKCRRTRLRSERDGTRSPGGRWNFCKTDDGWKIAP